MTTRIKDVIKTLLHTYYETRRLEVGHGGADWMWNYKSGECATNYLGHILHYVDGMIVEVRDRQTIEKE